MEKSWVWLPRNSIEYAEGANQFVNASSKSLGYPTEIFCPCIDCRNVSHQPVDAVIDHLVIRGMDEKYKRKTLWTMHGETREDKKGDVLNECIQWPLDKIDVNVNTSPEVSPRKSTETTSKSTSSSKSSKQKCILLDCNGSGRVVAEGRVCSTDPNDRVHFVPLGPNASKIWIDVSKIGDAVVWRPNSEVQ